MRLAMAAERKPNSRPAVTRTCSACPANRERAAPVMATVAAPQRLLLDAAQQKYGVRPMLCRTVGPLTPPARVRGPLSWADGFADRDQRCRWASSSPAMGEGVPTLANVVRATARVAVTSATGWRFRALGGRVSGGAAT